MAKGKKSKKGGSGSGGGSGVAPAAGSGGGSGGGHGVIEGTSGDDLLEGTLGNDKIKGKDGDDTILGSGGDDKLDGGKGDDLIDGGDGDDRIFGRQGNDTIFAGDGDDWVHGHLGDDLIDGGLGDDSLFGHHGNDRIDGGDGDDRIWGHHGDDSLIGGDGDDRIDGFHGNDVIDGGDGDDLLAGGQGDDTVLGGDGDDILFGDIRRGMGSGRGSGRGGHGSGGGSASGHGSHGSASGHGSDGSGGGSASGHGSHGSASGHGSDGSGGGSASGHGSHGSASGHGSDGSGGGSASGHGSHGSASGHGSDGSGSGSAFGHGSHGSASGHGSDGSGGGSASSHGSHGSGSASAPGTGAGTGDGLTFNDYLDGGAGSDWVFGQQGDDTGNYVLSENAGASDHYDGGKGFDTLRLVLSSSEFANAAVQADIAAFQDFLAVYSDPTTSNGPVFEFSAFDLDARNWEALEIVIVDGGPNSAPTDIALSGDGTLDEDAAIGTVVGLLSATDPDPGDTASFSILADPDGKFVIAGDELQLAAGLDFEASGSHSVTVRVTDGGGNSYDEVFVIGVGDVNEAPTGIALDNASVDENLAGAAIGTLAVSDPDAGDSHTLTVDDARFEVVGGQLKLKAGESLDHETDDGVVVTVTATDAGLLQTAQGFTLTVNDLNEAPTGIALDNASVDENLAGAAIGTLAVSDPDAGDSHTLTVDDARFEVVGGQLKLKAGESLDHETDDGVVVTVTATDAGLLQTVQGFALTVNDLNEAPSVALVPALVNLAEDADTSLALKVADIVVSDDALGINDLSLSGADAGLFEIVGSELRLKAGTGLDFETNPSLDVTVEVDDATVGAAPDATAGLSVAVNNVNEAPTVALANVLASLDENSDTASPTKVADIVVSDDALGTESLSLSGADAALFSIVGSELFLNAGVALDFEAQSQLDVAVDVDDPALGVGVEDSAPLSLAVNDVNEAPTVALANVLASLDENSDTVLPTKVADIVVSDDALGTESLSLSGADAALFSIVGSELFLKAGVALDFEAQSQLDVAVDVDDPALGVGVEGSAPLILAVNDVNDAPTVGTGVEGGASEDDPVFAVDLLATATDPDASDTLNVSGLGLEGGDDSGVTVSVDGNSLSVDPSAYNALAVGESEVIAYSYEVTDGNGGSVTQSAFITIDGENDGPSVGAAIVGGASEDDAVFAVDFLAGATDPDASDTLDVSGLTLTGGDASGVTVSVDGNSLSVDPTAYNALAFGESEVITYSYAVADGNGGSVTQSATITITGENDAPTAVDDALTGPSALASDLDAFVANSGGPNSVWLNIGPDGSGDPEFVDSGLSVGAAEPSVAVDLGDVDGDGDLDAMVANSSSLFTPLTLWINDGAGNFSDVGMPNIVGAYDVKLADLDGDNDLDAFIAVDYAVGFAGNQVLMNVGGGTFTYGGAPFGYARSRGVALGDLDGDGDLDAFTANYLGGPNQVWLNQGFLFFTDSGQTLGNSSSTDVALADLDGDGDLDAFVTNDASLADPGYNKVWLNQGGIQGGTQGDFADSGQDLADPLAVLGGDSGSTAVALGDLDGDGDIDAYVTNKNVADRIWLNDGAGNFSDSGLALVGGAQYDSNDVDLADLDGDGDLDAYVVGSAYNFVFINDGLDGGGNLQFREGQTVGTGLNSYGVALGDLDGDSGTSVGAVDEDTPTVILAADLLANDSDPDASDVLTITAVGGALNGSVALDVNDDVLFTPDQDFNGTANFVYTIEDGNGGSATATVTFTVNAVNDAPEITLPDTSALYFAAADGVSGTELWRFDGANASLAADINPGGGTSFPDHLVNFQGKLFFAANDGVNGTELWSYDSGGASLAADINPSFGSFPTDLTVFNGDLYFSADGGVNGAELWKLDGVTGLASEVADINPFFGSFPDNLTVFGGDLYFSADNGVDGAELWKLDGVSGLASQVADVNAGPGFSFPSELTVFNNDLYFNANDGVDGPELWKLDGLTGLTSQVADINTDPFFGSDPTELTVFDGDLYFSANDGADGAELWKLDGVTGLASQAADINPNPFLGSSPSSLTVFEGNLYFSADDGVDGAELWKFDGTTASQVADINVGAGFSAPFDLMVFGGDLYFTANDGVNGDELWRLDGTVASSDSNELLVNTLTTDEQLNPSIASLADGGFVVVWVSKDPATVPAAVPGPEVIEHLPNIQGQRYDAAGNAVGGEFQVNSETIQAQSQPSVTGLAGGGFAVTWNQIATAPGEAPGIEGRVFDAFGTAPASEFQIETELFGGGPFFEPAVASLTGGGFVVGWSTAEIAVDGDFGAAKAQLFDATGAPTGGAFVVNSITDGNQILDAVAGLDGGGFVAVWSLTGLGTPDSDGGIGARLFNAAGAPLGPEFLVNTDTVGEQARASVAALPGGGFVVTWQASGAAGAEIRGQLFDAFGAPVGTEFDIDTNNAATQQGAQVTALANGGFVVSWQSGDAATGDPSEGIAAREFDAAGAPVGGEFLVNQNTVGSQFLPAVAGLTGGGFAAAWTTFDSAAGDASASGIAARIIGGPGGTTASLVADIRPGFPSSFPFGSEVVDLGAVTGEDTLLILSGLSVFDLDAGSDPLEVTLAVGSGTLALTDITGLTVTDGFGGDGTLTFEGSQAALNAALANSIQYQGIQNFNGTDALTITVNDQGATGLGGPLSATASLDITVQAVNDAPIANNDVIPFGVTAPEYVLTQASALNWQDATVEAELFFGPGSTLATIHSAAENAAILAQLSGGGFGSQVWIGLSDDAVEGDFQWQDGSAFDYDNWAAGQPDDSGGQDFVAMNVADGTWVDLDGTELLFFVVESGGRDPVLPPADEDSVLNIDGAFLLSNDTDVDGDSPVISSVVGTSQNGAQLTFNVFDGSIDYDPTASNTIQALAAGETLEDTFSYTITDGNGGFDNASVSITVAGLNDAPVANGDAATLAEDGSTSIDVLANDTDVDSGETASLSVASFGQGTNGAVQEVGGELVYTPDADFNGTDSFTYTVEDVNGATDSATVNVTVNPINDAPVIALPETKGLFFRANDGVNGQELWRFDGATTSLVADIRPGSFGSGPGDFAVFDGNLYFEALDNSVGGELFRYDGVSVSLAADIRPGSSTSTPRDLTVFDGALHFTASGAPGEIDLWKFDGTTATQVTDSLAGDGSNPTHLAEFDGKLFYRASDGTNGAELWSFDGVSATLEADILTGSGSSTPESLTVFDGDLYFRADDGVTGPELWRFNGTTASVIDTIPGAGGVAPSDLTVFRGDLYFRGTDGDGTELWKYNGFSASQVADINPGSGSSTPTNLHVFDGALYFSALDGTIAGRELWKFDGTTATQAADINPSGSSNPGHLAEFEDDLYFQASDGVNGTEVWRFDGTTASQVTGIDPSGFALPSDLIGVNLAATDADTPLTISGISVSDVDAGTDPLAVTLAASHGALAFSAGTTDLTFSDSDGSDGTLAFTGAQADINAALANSIVYTPEHCFAGTDGLVITVNDQGATGAGGALTDTATLEITVNPVVAIQLSGLDGTDGFRIADDTGGQSAQAVSGAGDINGDGFADVIVGATGSAIYMVFGKAGGFSATFDPTTLDGTNGFQIDGAGDTSGFGEWVRGAGDVNGDGIDDFMVGADETDVGVYSNAGQSYVVFGKTDFSGSGGAIDVSLLDGTDGFRFNRFDSGDRVGISVSGAGDVDGDGLADMIIGAHYAANHGETYLVFGGLGNLGGLDGNADGVIDLADVDGTNGFRFDGFGTDHRSGFSATTAGDVNGDGFADFIIGARNGDPEGKSGAAKPFWCSAGSPTLPLSTGPAAPRSTGLSTSPPWMARMASGSMAPSPVTCPEIRSAVLATSTTTASTTSLSGRAAGTRTEIARLARATWCSARPTSARTWGPKETSTWRRSTGRTASRSMGSTSVT